jgi:hypothetical protein
LEVIVPTLITFPHLRYFTSATWLLLLLLKCTNPPLIAKLHPDLTSHQLPSSKLLSTQTSTHLCGKHAKHDLPAMVCSGDGYQHLEDR